MYLLFRRSFTSPWHVAARCISLCVIFTLTVCWSLCSIHSWKSLAVTVLGVPAGREKPCCLGETTVNGARWLKIPPLSAVFASLVWLRRRPACFLPSSLPRARFRTAPIWDPLRINHWGHISVHVHAMQRGLNDRSHDFSGEIIIFFPGSVPSKCVPLGLDGIHLFILSYLPDNSAGCTANDGICVLLHASFCFIWLKLLLLWPFRIWPFKAKRMRTNN